MSNLVYPSCSSVNIINPLKVTLQFQTLKSTKFNTTSDPQRVAKQEFPTRLIEFGYKSITPAEIETIYQFYIDMQGGYDDFTFFFPTSWDVRSYENEYVGIGDGSTLVFNMPCKSATTYKIYIDETESGAGEYTYDLLGGTVGEDQIEFATAPADGEVITADFTAHLKVRCYFAEDELNYDVFSDFIINSTGIKLQGLLNG
jgi:hypothetical protein